MRMLTRIAAVACASVALVSCLFDNTMSYPPLRGEITTFVVEGQKEVIINPDSLTVEVILEETAEMDNLKLLDFAITDKTTADRQLSSPLDLTEPIEIVLSTYPGQEYKWTISATQHIDRYVKCNGYIDALFNPKDREAMVFVIEQPIEDMLITDMKLEPETSVITSTTGYDGATLGLVTKPVEFPTRLDCTLARQFTVLYKGVEYVWTVSFIQQKIVNEVKSVDAWAFHADVIGDFDGTGTPYYEYKKADDTEWIKVDNAHVDGVKVKSQINGLEQDTEYVVRLISAEAVGSEFSFRTEVAAQIHGMGFNDWHIGGTNGKTMYPYAEGDLSPMWDTANPGVSSLISNTTVPEYEHKVEGEAAAKMESTMAIVKFAAGNIFTGKFAEFKDMVARLEWGVPFTSRPHSLKGWYDYKPGIINRDEMGEYPELMGQPDIMQIMVALFAEGEGSNSGPYTVLSNEPGKPDLHTDPRVIALGELISSESTGGEYIEFEIPLTYREGDTRKPAYVIVVGCASYHGDFFTGAVGSTLYLDAFEFTYR